ncbi:phosphate ABC transporter substrate-binding protein (PhoT family) [Sinobacterium caligoides]|uniref:Phosphate ABC transporter substrate-binding protein (PhoT family) n=1 Tax=Sinobacterium caligoides TaxID=933926 RepID=A0A3N2E0A7_9GAMM|nr:substrate-binding domain-containing protein [Sinobacterium caligoides]ROS05342.1 phosphate ABC transporter substrate-binding protein (PhoT family) [Sinobacterium caligoides]
MRFRSQRHFLIIISCLCFSIFTAVRLNAAAVSAADKPELLFRLAGSNTVGGRLAPALVMEYLRDLGAQNVHVVPSHIENEVRILGSQYGNDGSQSIAVDISAHGSSTGFKWLNAGRADIAMSSRAIKQSEVKLLERFGDMNSFDNEHVIAIDGLAIIVHPDNSLNELSKPILKRIFSGEIDNWRQLGGDDRAITLYARDDNSGTWDTFRSLVLGKKTALASGASRYESNAELSAQVEADRGGIGFVPLAAVAGSKLLAVSDRQTRAMKPERINVATEDYPLARRLYLYSKSNIDNPHVDDFLSFVLSEKGQSIVENIGFISQNIIAVEQQADSSAPAEYLQLTQQSKRLSVNFYFSPASAVLDNKGQRDLLRLEGYFASSDGKQRVSLVGFSDVRSKSSLEKVLAKHRALMVKNKLIGKVENIEPVMSLGAFMPIANNGDVVAKMKNGRVEVWVSSVPSSN